MMSARQRNVQGLARVPSAGNMFGLPVNPTRSVRTLVVVVGFVIAMLAMFRGTLHHHDSYTESRRAHHGSFKTKVDAPDTTLLNHASSGVTAPTTGQHDEAIAPLRESTANEESKIDPRHGLEESKSVEGEANSREGADSSSHKKVPAKEQKEHRNTNLHERGSKVGMTVHGKFKHGKEHPKEVTKKRDPAITVSSRSERPTATLDVKPSEASSETRARGITDTLSNAESEIATEDGRENPLSLSAVETAISDNAAKHMG
eukprot:7073279-Pyramimonas_sp.AAC.1